MMADTHWPAASLESNPISIERGGGIPGGFCEFDDTFATAATYKTYRID